MTSPNGSPATVTISPELTTAVAQAAGNDAGLERLWRAVQASESACGRHQRGRRLLASPFAVGHDAGHGLVRARRGTR